MTRGPTLLLFGMIAMTAPLAPIRAQSPALAEWDRLIVDALKEAHNKGADLYNGGDAAGGFRLYQGALLTARPLLAHRPAAQKLIDDGFADVTRSAGMVKLQAFRLHEVIEQVRGELKAGLKADAKGSTPPKSAELPKPPTPTPRSATTDTEPLPRVSPMPPKDPPPTPAAKPPEPMPAEKTGVVEGRIVLDGKPVGGAEVAFVSVVQPPRTFKASATAAGVYTIRGVPAGDYLVTVTSGSGGAKVPPRFQSPATSGLTVKVTGGPDSRDFELKGS